MDSGQALRADDATYDARCVECGGRIHRSDIDAPWMHGHPKNHDARPPCVDCGADAWFSRLVAVTDVGRVTFAPVCATHRADPWKWAIP